MGELLTGQELAERLRVSPSTIREWAREGRIPEVRISGKVRRFDFAEVLAVIRERHRSRESGLCQ